MIAALWILLAVALLALAYALLISPAPRPEARELLGWLYAHRGLHGDGVPENSLAAFERAAAAGYGMELDVQLTCDGRLVVFHDETLRRVCGVEGRLCDMTYDQLRAAPLPDGSAIPLFADVLALVNGRVPLIVEIKHHGGAERNARAALEALQGYAGPYCVESFHPLAVRYFKKHAPNIVRGQLASGDPARSPELSRAAQWAMRQLLVNAAGRPHFVAYTAAYDHTLGMWMMKRVFHPLLAAWTIRDQDTLDRVSAWCDMPIFERFIPRG